MSIIASGHVAILALLHLCPVLLDKTRRATREIAGQHWSTRKSPRDSLILRLMARGIGLIWVYRIFMTGHRFDSRTRDFDITIFTSERVWEIKGIRILVTLLA